MASSPGRTELLSGLSRQFSSRSSRSLYLDNRLIFCSSLLTMVETYGSDAEDNDERDERPSRFLQEVRRLRSTHHLVAASETCSQSSAFTILYQHQERQQDSGDND